jgi:hypothetical protein
VRGQILSARPDRVVLVADPDPDEQLIINAPAASTGITDRAGPIDDERTTTVVGQKN